MTIDLEAITHYTKEAIKFFAMFLMIVSTGMTLVVLLIYFFPSIPEEYLIYLIGGCSLVWYYIAQQIAKL